MNAPPLVRHARSEERRVVSAILHDAFVDEAGLNYWLRQGAHKDRARQRFFEAATRTAVHAERELWLAESGREPLGAAIWLAPGRKAFEYSFLEQLMMTPLLLSIAGSAGMSRAMLLGEKLASHHPREPHAHLVFLGVSSAAQGRGVGSAMLKHTLAPLDKQGVAAYLEASTERNVALYARHGFVVTGEFELPGLHFWTMTRAPRA